MKTTLLRLALVALFLAASSAVLHAQAPAPSGIIFTIAGGGTGGLGDGGLATRAAAVTGGAHPIRERPLARWPAVKPE